MLNINVAIVDVKKFPELIEHINTIFQRNCLVCSQTTDIYDTQYKNIVIPTFDHWGDDEFLLTPPDQLFESNIASLKEIVTKRPDKMFYVMTVCPFLHEYYPDVKNLKIIHWGEDFELRWNTEYQGIRPISTKLFEQSWHWTYLSYNVRMHRDIGALFLLGKTIPNGFIKFDPSFLLQHDSWQGFEFYLKFNNYSYLNSLDQESYDCLQQGFNRVSRKEGYTTSHYRQGFVDEIDVSHPRAGVENFNRYLRPIYQNSIIDIVAETVFLNRTGIVTEKYLNTVYGYNFLIYISMRGTVDHIRSLGFDVFDDIIDHSYDNIEDHYIRLTSAINKNLDILCNRDLAIQQWYQCRHRFERNVLIAEEILKNKTSKAINSIRSALNEVNCEIT